MVLESLSLEKANTRVIYVLQTRFQIHSFKIGRGHESDLRINDISVSRCHATIKCLRGKFFLQDNMSKFSTLILIRRKLPIPIQ